MRSLILPILYFLSLELVLIRPSLFFWVALALIVASILGVLQISKRRRLFLAICPLMFLVASFFLLPLIGGEIVIHIYVILAAFVFWLCFFQLRLFFSSEEKLLKNSLDLGRSLNLAACFLWFSGIYGLYINFYPSLWLVSLGAFFGGLLLSFHFLRLSLFTTSETSNYLPPLKFVLAVLIISLSIFQIFWALLFWPFTYLTIGVVLVIIYYIALNIWQSKFRGTLSRGLILKRLFLGGVLVALILATSKWLPF